MTFVLDLCSRSDQNTEKIPWRPQKVWFIVTEKTYSSPYNTHEYLTAFPCGNESIYDSLTIWVIRTFDNQTKQTTKRPTACSPQCIPLLQYTGAHPSSFHSPIIPHFVLCQANTQTDVSVCNRAWHHSMKGAMKSWKKMSKLKDSWGEWWEWRKKQGVVGTQIYCRNKAVPTVALFPLVLISSIQSETSIMAKLVGGCNEFFINVTFIIFSSFNGVKVHLFKFICSTCISITWILSHLKYNA